MNTIIIFGAKYLVVVPVVMAIWYFWKNREKRDDLGKLAVLSLPITYIISILARALYYDPRPFVMSGVEPLIQHVADNGFPSDHTLLAGALAAIIGKFDRKLGATLWVITLLIGTSRVLAGVHHWLDILGAIIISAVVARVIYFYYGRQK